MCNVQAALSISFVLLYSILQELSKCPPLVVGPVLEVVHHAFGMIVHSNAVSPTYLVLVSTMQEDQVYTPVVCEARRHLRTTLLHVKTLHPTLAVSSANHVRIYCPLASLLFVSLSLYRYQ
jgi:hypothetical protein